MSGGVVRHAAKKVNASAEIVAGLVLGIAGGAVWRSWHLSYKAAIDDYYKTYDAQQKTTQ